MDIIVKIRILIPCCIIFCSISCLSQSAKQTYTTMYDLKFTMNADSSVVAPWQENAAYLHASLPAFTQIGGRRLFVKYTGKNTLFRIVCVRKWNNVSCSHWETRKAVWLRWNVRGKTFSAFRYFCRLSTKKSGYCLPIR